MSKERTTISVDSDVYEYLQQSDVNASGLIQELVREYRDNEKRQVAALKLRLKHLEREATEAEERAQRKREEAEEVRELLEEAAVEETEKMRDVREKLSGLDLSRIDAENPAIQNQADRVNMEPKALLQQLRE